MAKANPLPQDGVVGRLTQEQGVKLKEFWAEFLRLVESAPEEGEGAATSGQKGAGSKQSEPPKDPSSAKSNRPKDDNAKEELRAEEERKEALAAFNLYGRRAFLAAFWRLVAMDNPDGIILRFLRARKWNVSAGVAMLAACVKWRIESDVEEIFEKGEEGMRDAEGFLKQMQMGKTYTQGTDRHGRPVVYINVAKHRAGDQSPQSLEWFIMHQMESIRCLFSPPVDKVTIVFNMTGFGLANMDWRVVFFILKCLESYYPESLNVLLVHQPPFVFQGIWKILAPMLDPVVRAKVQLTKTIDDLAIHIDKNHLDKAMGGNSTWEWSWPDIKEGENVAQRDTETRTRLQSERDDLIARYTTATKEWAAGAQPIDPHSVTDLKRDYLAAKMRSQYFELDPYIRGRGAYHRNGNIIGNGLVFFGYPGIREPLGEWEVRGYETCREQSEVSAREIAREIETAGASVPDGSPAS